MRDEIIDSAQTGDLPSQLGIPYSKVRDQVSTIDCLYPFLILVSNSGGATMYVYWAIGDDAELNVNLSWALYL